MNPRTRRWVVPAVVCALLLVATLVLSLVGGRQDEPGQRESGSATETASAPSTPSPAASSSPLESTSGSSSDPSPSPSSSSKAAPVPEDHAIAPRRTGASQGAVRVVTQFADAVKVKDRSAWWREVRPLLSPMGVSQMKGRSPEDLGFTKRTGAVRPIATEVALPDRYVAVGLPTDGGSFMVLVENVDEGWKITSVSRLAQS